MPLSKVEQAKWMRHYRAKNKILGITAKKTRDIVPSVIPKPSRSVLRRLALQQDMPMPELDADGNPIPDVT